MPQVVSQYFIVAKVLGGLHPELMAIMLVCLWLLVMLKMYPLETPWMLWF